MRTSNERCTAPPKRTLTNSTPAEETPAKENKAPDHDRSQTGLSRPGPRPSGPTASQVVAVDEALRQGGHPENVDLSLLAALLRRACGPSLVGAVVGRARLQDELTRHLGCKALMSKRLVDAMIGRGLIRQEVHRDGWVHWVVTV